MLLFVGLLVFLGLWAQQKLDIQFWIHFIYAVAGLTLLVLAIWAALQIRKWRHEDSERKWNEKFKTPVNKRQGRDKA
jgi:fumarate reductase subunit D